MSKIVEYYTNEKRLFKQDAVMLIIKPIKVHNTDISHHFIDWNPGLLGLVIKVHQVMFLRKQ